jgi:hypothetical protein
VFEQKRGPIVPQYLAAARAPLLFLPVRGGPVEAVRRWLAPVDGADTEALQGDFTQKLMRQWMRAHPGFRSFTVLRHPVPRLHAAFCRHFLGDGPEVFGDIRQSLRTVYGLPFPDSADDPAYDVAAHRSLFLAFARFVNGNLSGQTSIRTDASWASQQAILQGIAGFALPDRILREDDLAEDLRDLAASVGLSAPEWQPEPDPAPHPLAAFYDADVEAAVHQAYQRDYLMFGFKSWR